MDGTAFWIAALIASALVGLSKGGLPMIGMLAVPVLSLVISPVTAAGLLLPVFVVSDLFGLWAWRKAFDARVLRIVVSGAAAGIGIGWATASLVPEAAVTLLVGVIGLVFAANTLLRRRPEGPPRPARVGPGLFWGTIAGFTSFVSHAGAPPFQVYVLPLRLEKTVFAGTATIAFALINAMKLIPYWFLGQLNPQNLRVAAILFLPAVIAVFAGIRLVRWLPEKLFYRLVIWSLLAISVRLVHDGLTGLL
ncbi:sulfite exporter TauE/SafE family protein [Pseudogemmobacter humi]|uniref:Probable membrane transporter protein n=1 Tax=Pseudogemmobacter humi TaxID=2483812 RepID=A0A3P5WU60_9RHOB|nr:sulfite exporter TauE/SafE family protein [Pseudogemmobacter humi]VDC25245.1 Sulfite exporter TauE/SafE [Pseudogemmobacter humi]